MTRPREVLFGVMALGVVLLGVILAGCSTTPNAPESTTSNPLLPSPVTVNPALAEQVPQSIRQSGELTVGTNVPYAPMEFTRNGRIVGFDVDVIDRVARILGLRLALRETAFPDIIPGVAAGRFDVGARSLLDTYARERQVDMVTYFSAGTQWAQRTGGTVDPNNACGVTVAVEQGTVQADVEVPAKSKACTTLGGTEIRALPFESQQDAVDAVLDGRADAMSADSPATAYAIKTSDGRLAPAGIDFDTDPYGFAVAKGSPLGAAIQGAVRSLIDSGDMERLAAKWGIEEGVIATSTINGATN